MPGQRRTSGTRTKGSWLPRIVGFAVIVLLAVGGVTAYLVTFQPSRPHHAASLPTRVLSVQTVGLVGQGAQSATSGTQLLQLLGAGGTPEFSPLGSAQAAAGLPQWTADQMADRTYIFIFLPTGACLAATGPSARAQVQLQHCNLSARQRWRRASAPVLTDGHDFYQYENAGTQGCLSKANLLPASDYGVGLAQCEFSPQADQLIAFWWSV